MALRLVAFVLFGLWALVAHSAALAQTVRVTSGEHDGFSRIVLQFPGPVDWQLRRTDVALHPRHPRVLPARLHRKVPRCRGRLRRHLRDEHLYARLLRRERRLRRIRESERQELR